MTPVESARLAFFVALWLLPFNLIFAFLYLLLKRTWRHVLAHRQKKAGLARCQATFYCGCEKKNDHVGTKHVNETNMIVWE